MAGLVEIARTLRKGLDRDQIRCLIQELANSPENDVNTLERIGTSLEPKRVARAGECICSCVCSPMSPALWSALPMELLQLVFARLPLPKTIQLKSLSKSWNRSFTSELDTEFLRACTDAGPRVFAMITEGCDFGLISVRLYDTKSNRWYSYIDQILDERVVTMSAGDGGLVCFVSTSVNKKENPLVIFVFNPLTRHWRLLSPHALSKVQPRMVQLVMDEDTKCYKVIVVGEKRHRGGHATCTVAEIFCSETGVWSSAKAFPDLIFGYQYHWYRNRYPLYEGDDPERSGHFFEETRRPSPGAYDCGGRQLVEFDVGGNPCRGALVESYALVKDHLFVLHQKLFERSFLYVVSEYQYQGRNRQAKWVKLRVHKCKEFEDPPSRVHYCFGLHACKGFLLLKATIDEINAFEHELTWLYDLSTTKWQKVPNVPVGCYHGTEAMFELRWDAIP